MPEEVGELTLLGRPMKWLPLAALRAFSQPPKRRRLSVSGARKPGPKNKKVATFGSGCDE